MNTLYILSLKYEALKLVIENTKLFSFVKVQEICEDKLT